MADVLLGGILALLGTLLGGLLGYWSQTAAQRRTDADAGAVAVASLDEYIYAESRLSRLDAHLARIGLRLRALSPRRDRSNVSIVHTRFCNLARKAWYSSEEKLRTRGPDRADIDDDLRAQLDKARSALEEIFYRVAARPFGYRLAGFVTAADVEATSVWETIVEAHGGP